MPRAAPSFPLWSGPKWGGSGAGKQQTPEWALTCAEGLEVPRGTGQVPQSPGHTPQLGPYGAPTSHPQGVRSPQREASRLRWLEVKPQWPGVLRGDTLGERKDSQGREQHVQRP